jgi:formate hydrogenlyase subunit 6/NADH:ubiquinone oxidoreductase subunit I
VSIDERKLNKARRTGYGLGLLKGMAVTFKHLFKHNTVIQYPDEKQDLPARTRGVIALKEENCTVCMLCARECPDWCIYIDSHKETLPPKREGGRPRKRNVLDRFAIDYALCMYCGICVEVCPYDALFWSREFEYSEYDIRELTHEKERLSDWMATVLPPPELEVGAEIPGQTGGSNGAGTPAVAAGAAGPGSAQRPSPPAAATAAAERPEQAQRQPAAAATAAPPREAASQSQEQAGEIKAPQAEGRAQATEEKAPAGEGKPQAAVATQTDTAQPEGLKSSTEAASPDQFDRPEHDKAATTTAPERKPGTEAAAAEAGGAPHTTPGSDPQATAEGQSVEEKGESAPGPAGAGLSAEERAQYQESPGPNVEVPHETPQPVALTPTEDPEEVYGQVLQEQLDKGSSPQVAEARAKVARVKAQRGIKRGPTPIQTDKMAPSAPTKGHPVPEEPSGAPEAKGITPEPGPVAPTEDEAATAQSAPPSGTAPAPAAEGAVEPGPKPDASTASDAKSETAPSTPSATAPGGATEAGSAAPSAAGGEDPDAVYERVLAEEKAKGSSDAVAQGRAKAARVKAERARKDG